MQGKQCKIIEKKSSQNTGLKKNNNLRYSDFQFIRILGMGAFSKVELVERKGIKYALKIIQKRLLEREGKQYQAFIERELLKKINHPGIVELKNCFQDRHYLYFCLEYCQGGDFITFITNNHQKITDELRIFYIAQIVCILQYFNEIKIIHRDMKPQNILLNKNGHIKLTDFATAQVSQCILFDQKFKDILLQKKQQIEQKQFIQNNQQHYVKQQIKPSEFQVQKTSSQEEVEEGNQVLSKTTSTTNIANAITCKRRKATFVGTCFYIPPQLIQHEACSFASDLWALGCIMYQLYYEKPPFDGDGEYQIFEKIKNIDYSFPKNEKISEHAIDLIKKLLQKNPKERLGSNSRNGLSLQDLKQHKYFNGINFDKLFMSDVPSLLLLEGEHINQKQRQQILIKENRIRQKLKKYIINSKNILIDGIIQKRTFINYNYYYLIIFNNLKILRVKINQIGKIKETQIQLNKIYENKYHYPSQIINNNIFKLYTKQKLYKYKKINSYQWVNKINQRFKILKQYQQKDFFILQFQNIDKQFFNLLSIFKNFQIPMDQ